jgi:hypothetical protein
MRVEVEVGLRICDCSACNILTPLTQLFRRLCVTISNSNLLGRASAAIFSTPREVSCLTSASICAACTATRTPSCTFASFTVRLSVLVPMDTAIGQARRHSWPTWLMELIDMPRRDDTMSRTELEGSRWMTSSMVLPVVRSEIPVRF